MAGRNIGVNLFTKATWATSHGYGNSIFYAIWLGYTIGLAGIWIQMFWCLGICLYALIVGKLIHHTENYTLHGFLGSLFGMKTRYIASAVSLIGLFVCIGFEISFASGFFSQILGFSNLRIPTIIVFAIFIAAFCSIGGFTANARTDGWSNWLATSSVILLIFIIYIKFKNTETLNTILSKQSISNSFKAPDDNWFLIGLLFFGLYQFIDMTNWQTVSANSLKEDRKSIRSMQFALLKSAGLISLFPILTGTVVGYLFKAISSELVNQDTFIFDMIKGSLFDNSIGMIIALAFITFAFMASSLSATNSWLLASAQTISWDIFDYNKFKKADFKVSKMNDETQEKLTNNSKNILMIVGVVTSLGIYLISLKWAEVFNLQFVMFGAGLSMIPSLFYGLIFPNTRNKVISMFAFLSIASGLSYALWNFIESVRLVTPNSVYKIPPITLAISLAVFLLGILVSLICKTEFFKKQSN